MNKKIVIQENEAILFQGKILAMPIKPSAIIEKSTDLFDDEDPCIIHTSFVIKHFAESLLNLLEHETTVLGKDHPDTLNFLDVKNLNAITVTLK